MRQSKIRIGCLVYLAYLSLTFLVSCTKEKRQVFDSTSNSGPSGPATLSTIQVDIFRFGCGVSGCHDDRTTPSGNLSLINASISHGQLVNRASNEGPGLVLVVPGDPDNSYLIHKLNGTHTLVGGTGDRMPQYAAPVTQGDYERIVQWVTDGAQMN